MTSRRAPAGIPPRAQPVWWKEGRYLLFSDIHNNRRMKYEPGDGVTVFLEPTNRANGLTRDLQGRLIACEHDTRRVTRLEPDGSLTVIAHSFQGRQLNRPNGVVVRSDGCIYFTDPWTNPAPQQQWDLTFAGVYRLTPDLGTMTLLVDDFVLPNGLAFSADEKLLYINDSRRHHIRAFELLPNGTLAKQTDRVFADLSGDEPGVPDGMKVDIEGNVYCGGSGGIWIMDPSGKKLGRIVHGQPATTNIAFGGDDWKTLYFTSRTHLGSVNVKIPGCRCRYRKRPPGKPRPPGRLLLTTGRHMHSTGFCGRVPSSLALSIAKRIVFGDLPPAHTPCVPVRLRGIAIAVDEAAGGT